MFLILHNPQFRLLLAASLAMSMAQLIFMMVQPWLALEATDSVFWVGATVGAAGAGLLSFSVVGGVLADRVDRRKLIIGGAAVQTLVAGGIAVLAFAGQIKLGYIMMFAFADSALMAILVPSFMALLLDVVGKERLLSAVSIDHVFSGAAGIGVPIAVGAVLNAFDIAWAYVIVAACDAAGVVFLLRLRSVAPVEKAERASPIADLKEAVRFVFTTPTIRALILGVLVIEYFGFMHEPMMPVMARDVLDAGPSGLGYLFSAGSAGSLVASLVLAGVGDIKQKGRLLAIGAAAFGGLLIAFAWSRSLPMSLGFFGLAYAGLMVYDATMQTLLQVTVPNEMRGRVLGFQTVTWGIVMLSGFQTGAIATAIGAPATIALGGGVAILTAVILFRRVGRIDEVQPEEPVAAEQPA